jgi:hypothetical protein
MKKGGIPHGVPPFFLPDDRQALTHSVGSQRSAQDL